MFEALPRVIPFGLFLTFIALDDLLEDFAMRLGVDPRWRYALRVVVVAGALAFYWGRYVELQRPAPRARDWLLAACLGAVVFLLWINLDGGPFTFGTSVGFDPRSDGSVDWALAISRIAGAVLVVPPAEELFWRSFVMRWIANPRFLDVLPARVGLKAVVLSSVVFAVEHYLWFAGLLAGLAYAWLYMRTGNLWVAVAAHAVTNGLLAFWVLYTGRWDFW